MEALSRNDCCSGKTKIIAYSECVSVTLSIQDTLRVHHIVISCVAVRYLSPLSYKRHDFQKTVTEHKMCLISSRIFFSGPWLILNTTERDNVNVLRSSCKVPVILVIF
jgi:hypothetical protein